MVHRFSNLSRGGGIFGFNFSLVEVGYGYVTCPFNLNFDKCKDDLYGTLWVKSIRCKWNMVWIYFLLQVEYIAFILYLSGGYVSLAFEVGCAPFHLNFSIASTMCFIRFEF